MTTPTEIELPEQSPSRIHKADPWSPDAGAAPDVDVDAAVTANQRIAAFYAKHPTGRIETIVHMSVGESTEIKTFSDETARTARDADAVTVIARVYRDQHAAKPAATGTATRRSDDANLVVAERPQETAETVAVSRALRFLGILVDR